MRASHHIVRRGCHVQERGRSAQVRVAGRLSVETMPYCTTLSGRFCGDTGLTCVCDRYAGCFAMSSPAHSLSLSDECLERCAQASPSSSSVSASLSSRSEIVAHDLNDDSRPAGDPVSRSQSDRSPECTRCHRHNGSSPASPRPSLKLEHVLAKRRAGIEKLQRLKREQQSRSHRLLTKDLHTSAGVCR